MGQTYASHHPFADSDVKIDMKRNKTEPAQKREGTEDSLLVARQPIFAKDMSILGYELLFRHCDNNSCRNGLDFNQATLMMIADGFSLAATGIDPRKKICVNVTPETLLGGHILALPPDKAILEINASEDMDERLLEKCAELKKLGFQLTLDNYSTSAHAERFLPLADYVKLAIPDYEGKQVAAIRQKLRRYPCKLIASRIENWEMFSGSKFLGFDYFQGFFFSHAEIIPGRKPTSISAIKLKLMKDLSQDEIDVKSVVATLSKDPSLSVRLLKFINSKAFSMVDKVDSIARAVSILGIMPLKRWTMAALLADADASDKGQELMLLALHRAFFLSSLAELGFSRVAGREALFLLGLLSLADSLFGMRMEDLVASLPLEPYMKDALLMKPGNGLADLISLLRHIERNDWEPAGTILKKNGIPSMAAARLYMQSSREAAGAIASMSK